MKKFVIFGVLATSAVALTAWYMVKKIDDSVAKVFEDLDFDDWSKFG